ncbi:MAG: hypothetical protein ABID61_01295 [Candidatus Micrarchaeota archaeon]
MVKTRIIKRQDKSYIELPPELSNYDAVEFFLLRDGYYLLTVPLTNQNEVSKSNIPEKDNKTMSDREMSVLKKLLSIRFENRIPTYISKAFSDSEKEILKTLEQKKVVNLFKGRKYVDGVYNVPDSTYALVQKNDSPQSSTTPVAMADINPLVALKTQGFVIFTDKREAFALSEKLSNEMKSGAIVGVKGFDGKFYVVTRECLTTIRGKITLVLKKDMDVPSIATASKTDIDGCTAVLRLMAESGDIIEKKKGIFAPV